MNKIIGIMFAFFMVSCAVQNPFETKAIQGKWEIVSLNGENINSTQPVYLDFGENNMLSGNTGCNQVTGKYTVTLDKVITFSQLGSTRMACEPKQMALETQVLEMLDKVNNFNIAGDKISLSIGLNAPIAELRRMSDNEIVNKYWKLTELNGKKVTMLENQEKEQYFILKSDNTITGFAGCNTFNGKYTLKEGMRISFDENMAITMKACPDVDFNESELMQVFLQADNYSIHDDHLSLNIGRRAPLAKFEAVYF